MNANILSLFIILVILGCVFGFAPKRLAPSPRVKQLHENFFLDIAEDPAKNTPSEIFGEVAYKDFVGSYKPNSLLLGGDKCTFFTFLPLFPSQYQLIHRDIFLLQMFFLLNQ